MSYFKINSKKFYKNINNYILLLEYKYFISYKFII